MADKQYTIRILTVSDASGLKQTAQGFDEVTGNTKKSSEANEEHHKSFLHMESSARLVHGILHNITEQFPLLGEAARLALSPQGAALFGIVMALRYFQQAEEQAMQAAKEKADETTESFVSLGEKAEQLSTAASDSAQAFTKEFVEVARQQTNAKAQTDAVTTGINAQKDALHEVLKVQEALALAEAKTEIQRESVRQRFGHASNQLELDAQRRIFEAKQSELNAALEKSRQLEAESEAARLKVYGPEGESRQAQQQKSQDASAAAKKNLQSAQEELGEILSRGLWGIITHFGMGESETDARAKVKAAEEQVRFHQERAAALEREQAESKSRADSAEKLEMENARIIQELQAELPRQRAQLGLKEATFGATEAYGRETGAEKAIGVFSEQISRSAGSGFNLGGLGTSLVGFTENIALWVQTAQLIKASNESVKHALKEVAESAAGNRDTARNISTRLMPGAQP